MKGLLALGGIFLGLLLAELATRVAGGGGASANRAMFFEHDAHAGWRCKAGLDLRFALPGSYDVRVTCNARGHRDRDHALAKAPGTRRLVCLGDSYLWGQGLANDATFTAELERAWPGCEAINLGVAGYSTVQELALFATDGRPFAPDWTVVLFCDNDLDSNFEDKDGRRPRVELRGDEALHLVDAPAAPPSEPVTQWLHRHSRLVLEFDWCIALVRERHAEQVAAARSRDDDALPRPTVAPPTATGPVDAAAIRFSLLDRFLAPDARMDQAWRTLQQLYARLRDDAAAQGSRLLIVYVPDPRLAVPAAFQALLAQSGVSAERADWNRPGARLAQLCAELGVPCIDLAPSFRSDPDPARLFLHRDPHWSAAGARLAATIVATRLRELDAAPAAGR